MAGYEIVGAAIGFVGLVAVYSYKVFYQYIVVHEKEVRKKVKDGVITEVKNYKKTLKENTPEALVDILAKIASFTDLLDESKKIFEITIFFGGLLVVALSFLYVFPATQQLSNLAGTVGAVVACYLIYRANKLRQNKTTIERFLDDEPVEDILEDEE